MKKNWIGTVVLVGMSMVAGSLLPQMWEQVLGQPVGFSVEAPQVVVNQPAELPKWCVDFVTLPPLQGETLPRIRVITVVDTESKRIAVYHMDLISGSVKLLTVRNIQPDLTLDQYNPTGLLPTEIMRDKQRLDGKR